VDEVDEIAAHERMLCHAVVYSKLCQPLGGGYVQILHILRRHGHCGGDALDRSRCKLVCDRTNLLDRPTD
jgi:hypothetical protein